MTLLKNSEALLFPWWNCTLFHNSFCFFNFPEFPSLIVRPTQESFSCFIWLSYLPWWCIVFFYADDILIYLFPWTFQQQFQSCQPGRIRLKTKRAFPQQSTYKHNSQLEVSPWFNSLLVLPPFYMGTDSSVEEVQNQGHEAMDSSGILGGYYSLVA